MSALYFANFSLICPTPLDMFFSRNPHPGWFIPLVASKSFAISCKCAFTLSLSHTHTHANSMRLRFRLLRFLAIFTGFLHLANSTWWYLSQLTKEDPKIFCHFIPKGHKRQREICLKHAEVMKSIAEGIRNAITECQYQFRSNKWNCSIFERDTTVFGKHLVRGGTRELSFLHAITTASTVLTLAKHCSDGKLVSCGCSFPSASSTRSQSTTTRRGRGGNNVLQFKWKGCSENVIYSLNFVRRFVDSSEQGIRDTKARMTLHNNCAGRQAFEKYAPVICTCHGVSGSCTMQTCWRTVPSIRAIGDSLKEKYDGAIRITLNNNGNGRLIPIDHLQKRPSKLNLVYYEDSPDFCSVNRSRGLVGTGGRACNSTSEGEDSCDILCCGQGWNSALMAVSYRCECRFNWCCDVQCKMCQEQRLMSHCK